MRLEAKGKMRGSLHAASVGMTPILWMEEDGSRVREYPTLRDREGWGTRRL
ncbi:MAG TPA: hypothetical protein VHS13_10090 [Edaphobacter sp.]|nr:hypothetical protein [Edaphobacter sp.]